MKILTVVLMTLWVTTLSAASLAQKQINLGEYENVETEYRGNEADIIKKIRLAMLGDNERVQVVLTPFSSSASFDGVDGGKSATAAMKVLLQDGGNIEIIDRNIPKQLLEEMRALEMGGVSQGQSFNLAQYAIRGEVLELSQGATWTDKKTVSKDGKNYTTPASCTLTGRSKVNIRVYNMNPLELMESFVVGGSGISNSENVPSCQKITDNGKSVVSAIADAVGEKKNHIKNMFSPAGLISGHMVKGKKHIFRTTLSPTEVRSDGTVLKLKIFKLVKNKDQITGQTRTLKSEIGVGKPRIASDTGEVWAQVSKKVAGKIMLGDTVTVSAGCDGPMDLGCLGTSLIKKAQ